MKNLTIIDYTNNDDVINEVAVDDKNGRLAARLKIESFQKSFQEAIGSETGEMEEINNNGLKEHFIDGGYIRELFIPKGIAIVSRLWTKERFWVIATGEVTFTTEMGTQRVKAPYTKVVPPGSKVALYTHEDTLWFAMVGAEATTNSEAEAELTADDYTECNYPWEELSCHGDI